MHIQSFILTVFLTSLSAIGEEIIPKGWLTPEQLLQAEDPIQSQLDTGQAMAPTAWNMAAVRDARLLLIYLAIYERLPDADSKNKFTTDQQAWLRQREKAVNALSDPKGGSMVSLDQASKHMELTQIRIGILQKKLDQMKNAEPTGAGQPATPPQSTNN